MSGNSKQCGELLKISGKTFLIEFDLKGDEGGRLIAIENNKDIPFNINRVFFIFGTKKDVVRGQHANKLSKFVLVALSGSCIVKTYDGYKTNEYILDRPTKGLFIKNMVWKDMFAFSSDCILLVLTDHFYDGDEYIRDIRIYDRLLKTAIHNNEVI